MLREKQRNIAQTNNQTIGMTLITQGFLGMGKKANSWAYISKLVPSFLSSFLLTIVDPIIA